MVSEAVARNIVWGFALTLLALGILILLGGLMAIPAVGIDQGVIVFLLVGGGSIWLARKLIIGLRLSKKYGIPISQ